MKHIILGTAGHVDHGKTELIKTLTGVDTDRLKEEKEKGISIELGFAPLRFDDLVVGIVDVPGHEKFIKSMVSGATGIDIVLLCVDAKEGIKLQTKEHIHICKLLSIKKCISVITKSDLVSEKALKDLQLELKDFLKENSYLDCPTVAVSSKTLDGIENLKEVIHSQAKSVEEKRSSGIFMMPLDRVFAIKGFGTIVTGTSQRGTINKGQNVFILSSKDKAFEVSARGIKTFGESVESASGGMRVAVNIAGVDKEKIKRGDILVGNRNFKAIKYFDSYVEFNKDKDAKTKLNKEYKIHFGTQELQCSVKAISPVEDLDDRRQGFYARIGFKEKAFIELFERFIIRDLSPLKTRGGGILLNPMVKRSITDSDNYIDSLISIKGDCLKGKINTVVELTRLKGITKEDIVFLFDRAFETQDIEENIKYLVDDREVALKGGILVNQKAFNAFQEEVKRLIGELQKKNPSSGGIKVESLWQKFSKFSSKEVFDNAVKDLINSKVIIKEADLLKSFSDEDVLSDAEKKNINNIARELKESGLTPPTIRELARKVNIFEAKLKDYLKHMNRRKEVVRVGADFYYSSGSIKELETRLTLAIKEKGHINVADFKALSGISRKFAIPLLEYFDREGITLRRPDSTRVLGPRAQ